MAVIAAVGMFAPAERDASAFSTEQTPSHLRIEGTRFVAA